MAWQLCCHGMFKILSQMDTNLNKTQTLFCQVCTLNTYRWYQGVSNSVGLKSSISKWRHSIWISSGSIHGCDSTSGHHQTWLWYVRPPPEVRVTWSVSSVGSCAVLLALFYGCCTFRCATQSTGFSIMGTAGQSHWRLRAPHISSLVQNCGNSSALTIELLLQNCGNSSALAIELQLQNCGNPRALAIELPLQSW